MTGALDGIKIVDLSRILAGPYCTQMLCDLGATVVKVEAPWGDDTRGWGPPFLDDGTAAYHLSCNSGKEIINVNLKSDPGVIHALLEDADVVVENFRPGQLERIIGPLSDHLIVCSITGFGQTGPRSQEPGYDIALQAMSGIMSVTGQEGASPVKVGVAWIDIITGLYAGNAILAALFERERNGKTQRLDISLWDCAIASLANQGQNFLISGQNPGLMGSSHPNLVPYQAFEASDGWIIIAIGSDGQWNKFCKKMNVELNWITNQERVVNRTEVVKFVQNLVKNKTKQEIQILLEGIPTSPINSISEALTDPQSVARGVITQFEGNPILASPLRFMNSE